jgi:hypothetical protein
LYIQTKRKTTNKNIQAMKATMKTKRNARAIAAAVALLSVLAVPVQAAAVNSKEVNDAVNRLEAYNNELEKAITFYVPVVTETVEEYLAFEAAEMRLEETVSNLEDAARYITPAVAENFEDYEVKEAQENLDEVIRQIEHSIGYTAPSVTE